MSLLTSVPTSTVLLSETSKVESKIFQVEITSLDFQHDLSAFSSKSSTPGFFADCKVRFSCQVRKNRANLILNQSCLINSTYPVKALKKNRLPFTRPCARRQFSKLAASLSTTSESDDSLEAWEQPSKWRHYEFSDIAKGVMTLVVAERLLAAAVQVYGVPFPAPVLMLAVIGAVMAGNTEASKQIYGFHEGAVAFFDLWMPMFFVPSVAGIALAPLPVGSELLKAVTVLGFTYLFNLWATAKLFSLFHSALNPNSRPGDRDRMSHDDRLQRIGRAANLWTKVLAKHSAETLRSVAQKSRKSDLKIAASAASGLLEKVSNTIQLPSKLPPVPDYYPLLSLALGVLLLLPAALLQTSSKSLLMTPGFLFLTFGLFNLAKRLPAKVRKWLSPTVVAGSILGVCTAYYGAAQEGSWRAGVLLYKQGAGVFLAMLIGPAVASLGFKVHTQRMLLRKCVAELALVCLTITPIGLICTALMGRFLGASRLVTASLLPATTTLGLAREMGPLLGSNPGLLVAGVTIAGTIGISTSRQLMGMWKVEGAAARGMAVGSSSHTLGASAIVSDEPQAAAVAGLTLALKGSLSVIAISIPQFRNFLLAIANPL